MHNILKLMGIECACGSKINRKAQASNIIFMPKLKALYQHIVDKNRSHDVLYFLSQENGSVHIRALRIVVL